MLDSKSKDLKFETHVDQSEPGEVLSQSPDMSSTRTKLTIRSSSRESSQSQNDQVIRTPMEEPVQDKQNKHEEFFLRMQLSLDEVLKTSRRLRKKTRAVATSRQLMLFWQNRINLYDLSQMKQSAW